MKLLIVFYYKYVGLEKLMLKMYFSYNNEKRQKGIFYTFIELHDPVKNVVVLNKYLNLNLIE